MFGFKKRKDKKLAEAERQNVLREFTEELRRYDISDEAFAVISYGFLIELLKDSRSKEKQLADLDREFAKDILAIPETQWEKLKKTIARSTSSFQPEYQEWLVSGIELYHNYVAGGRQTSSFSALVSDSFSDIFSNNDEIVVDRNDIT
ncbi:hypothetical protein [Vagococcus acidifermentans]|uniref:Uncharacterized protein n=1 Tax=Vagococcus acidifermentans TaxID=564710 RepID=A0A430ARC7_9ENTE|nr:hypothetical protein [Vagococcus acidifermentans]RSU10612.1 hypothetical protein CBF27_09850 [Vagococcus acidifermentans]